MNISSAKNLIQTNFTANMMPKNCAEHINNKLKSAKSVDIFCHSSSDEDTFNSAKAMYSYLESQGVSPRIIVSNGRECFGYNEKKYNILQADDINDKTQKADMALCVDFSAESRAANTNTLKYIQSYGNNIVGFDHHNNSDKFTTNFNEITKSYANTQQMPKLEAKNFYIDASAKSNCAIISRFFEAINHKTTHEQGRSLLAGMLDDTMKDGITDIVNCRVKVSESEDDYDNTKTVMQNVLSGLNIFDKLKVFKHFLDKTKLTEKEINFQKTLKNRTKYSENGKFAYVEITQDDKQWNDLGKDTVRSKRVLSDYRKEMLKKRNLDAVAVFFPTNTKNAYKMSLQSKSDYAKQIIDNIKATSYPELIAGGHDDRSGGMLYTSNHEKCQNWVKLFVDSAQKVLS